MLDPSRPFRVRVYGAVCFSHHHAHGFKDVFVRVNQTFHWPAGLPLPVKGNQIQVSGCQRPVRVLSITFFPDESLVTLEVR